MSEHDRRPVFQVEQMRVRDGYLATGSVIGQPGCQVEVSLSLEAFQDLAERFAHGPLRIEFSGAAVRWIRRDFEDREVEAPPP